MNINVTVVVIISNKSSFHRMMKAFLNVLYAAKMISPGRFLRSPEAHQNQEAVWGVPSQAAVPLRAAFPELTEKSGRGPFRKDPTPIKDPVVFCGEGRGLDLTPKTFLVKAGMMFLFKEISFSDSTNEKGKKREKRMNGWWLILIIAVWFVLQAIVLPKLGVST
jgi:hypothetical protein